VKDLSHKRDGRRGDDVDFLADALLRVLVWLRPGQHIVGDQRRT
jgi:hypothetical protein